MIAIGQRDAGLILASGGYDAEKIFQSWRSDRKVRPINLISSLDLRIDGKFRMVETDNFTFAFEPRGIPREAATALAEISEKAMQFDLQLSREANPRWKKIFTAYYADFDSNVFLLHHWGSGLSADSGVFMVYDGKAPDLAQATHDNAHALIDQNWGGSSSFLNEGTGSYAGAMATERPRTIASRPPTCAPIDCSRCRRWRRFKSAPMPGRTWRTRQQVHSCNF